MLSSALTLFMLISLVYNGNADLMELLWIWTYAGIAGLLYQFEISEKIHLSCLFAFFALILIHIASGGNHENFLSMGSANNISVYLFFFLFAGYLSGSAEKKPLKYIPLFLILAASLWAGNRGGALTAVVLIAFVLFYNFAWIEKGKIFALIRVALLVLLAVWALNGVLSEFMTAFVDKTERYGSESARTEIWAEYLRATVENAGNFLFGVNTNHYAYRLLTAMEGNPHNSFLMLHSKFGMAGLFCLLALFCKGISKVIKKKEPVVLIVIIVASTRMMFDWCAFPGIYDVLFWYLALYVLEKEPKGQNLNLR